MTGVRPFNSDATVRIEGLLTEFIVTFDVSVVFDTLLVSVHVHAGFPRENKSLSLAISRNQ